MFAAISQASLLCGTVLITSLYQGQHEALGSSEECRDVFENRIRMLHETFVEDVVDIVVYGYVAVMRDV